MAIVCSHCQATLRFKGTPKPGQIVSCPNCSSRFRVPSPKRQPSSRRKASSPSNRGLLIGSLIAGSLLLVGIGITLAVMIGRGGSNPVASGTPPPAPDSTPRVLPAVDSRPANNPGVPGGNVSPALPVNAEQAVWIDGQEGEPPPTGKDRPWLVLDTGGHSSTVGRVLPTLDDKEIITVSNDKTIRIWDVQSGDCRRVLRPQIGPGPEGGIQAAALSPDGKRLAVACIPARGGVGNPIHLIDLDNGQIDRLIRTGHLDAIITLDFSPDGNALVSGSIDRTARIHDLKAGTSRVLAGHRDRVLCVRFSPDGTRVASASMDKSLRIWKVADGSSEHVLLGATSAVNAVAWTRDGKRLAAGDRSGFIRIWSAEGTQIASHDISHNKKIWTQVVSLIFLSNDTEILFGGVAASGEVGIIGVSDGKHRIRFRRHLNSVMDVNVSRDGQVAFSAGGEDHEIYAWQVKDGTPLQLFKGRGRTPWGVGWAVDGSAIAWGNTNREDKQGLHRLERSFRLREFNLGPAPGKYTPAQHNRDGWQVRRIDLLQVEISRPGKPSRTFRSPIPTDRLYCWSILPNNQAVFGTSYSLFLLDLMTGKIRRTFVGHSGLITAVAPSPDGKMFVTGSSDQTLRFWSPLQTQPLLSLFIAGNDWIAWTPEGYYSASAYGERLMGWQINRGLDKLALYHPAARFHRSLFHPDAIRLVLPEGGIGNALVKTGKARKGEGPIHLAQVLPPEVTLLSPALARSRIADGKLDVVAEARSVGGRAVTALRLLVNGRPYDGAKGIRKVDNPKPGRVQALWKIKLPYGGHQLAVQAASTVSVAVSSPAVVFNTAQESRAPNLYILAVGISDYTGELKLNYAAHDAEAIAATFRENHGGVFGKVEARLVTDTKATRVGIVEGLSWLNEKMTVHDVGVVFFSGHGTRDERGQFYFVPVNVDPRNLIGTCVSGEALKRTLGNMKGRIIAMFDACHSGGAAESFRSGMIEDLARDLVSEDYGIVVMSSSLASEVSLESPTVRAGYFTYGLTEGMSGRADFNQDRTIHLHELDRYAALRVKMLTEGKQTPVTGRPALFPTFPLARLAK